MELTIRENQDRVVFAVSGQLSYTDIVVFTERLAYLNVKTPTEVVFDLEGLTYIDSSGIGLLIKAHDLGQKRGFQVVVRNATGDVRHILENANFCGFLELEL